MVTAAYAGGQASPQGKRLPPAPARTAGQQASRCSGAYSFLREGEVLQLTIQPGEQAPSTKVTGFISRHGELESDHGTLLDHWIRNGSLQSSELQFRTATIHGVWFEFEGSVSNGATPAGEGTGCVIRGKLTEHLLDANHHERAQWRMVELKPLPAPVE
ncbi:MAG: hypothetical protein JO041_08390 [Acidobacteria bacterium]|nr:hypothetical protein [Acidobacteriota bacterium]